MGLDSVTNVKTGFNSSFIGKTTDVSVLGSITIDCISYVPRLPLAGETLRASRYQNGHGGKGANQCVAAAKLGSSTVLIGKLGDDEWGRKYLEHLEEVNVNTKCVESASGRTTGLAQIIVSESEGENQIVIIPGANDLVGSSDVEKAQSLLDSSKVLICQLETPLPATLTALRNFKGISILNASPVPSDGCPLELFTLPTILCINEIEAGELSKRPCSNIEEAKHVISNFLCLGCHSVVITLGKLGAVFASADEPKAIHVRPPCVKEVLDTTGAGDAFVGALAHFIARYPDIPMYRKIGGAVTIASISVQKCGTQSSYPFAKDLGFDIISNDFDWSHI